MGRNTQGQMGAPKTPRWTGTNLRIMAGRSHRWIIQRARSSLDDPATWVHPPR